MIANIMGIISPNQTIAVALSGGSDSMALLNFLLGESKKLNFNVIALNVEHGIRGTSSITDSAFVKEYCKEHSIPLLAYSVDSIAFSKENKLSIEESARILRYNCFFDAIKNGKCDKVATAHHLSDNFESILFNLFRGTGLKGLTGITENYQGKIIRPFLHVKKAEILDYVKENNIPFVVDETNFNDDYTRNNLRLNIIPKIKEIFPEAEESLDRLSTIVKCDNDFLEDLAEKSIEFKNETYCISVSTPYPVFSRAVISIMKKLGVKKDWEKSHIASVFSLIVKENGSRVNLPNNITAFREYDKIVFALGDNLNPFNRAFALGEFDFNNTTFSVFKVDSSVDLKNGLFGDLNKIPSTAIIRTRKTSDIFTKFGGGTKSLGDYLTDKKIPLRMRDNLVLLADGCDVLCIFGVAISDKIKVDDSTKKIIKFSAKDKNNGKS